MRVWTAVLVAILLAGVNLPAAFAEMPAAGTVAPDFSLPSEDGSQVSLKDFRGKWVVLYFYPKDFTGGCTIEAHNFQQDQPEYAKRNAVVIGVSVVMPGMIRTAMNPVGTTEPSVVAANVVDAMRHRRPYVFTDDDHRSEVEHRLHAIISARDDVIAPPTGSR